MKVAVLSGGFSEEQHASRKSGKSIAKALEALGHNVVIVEYDEDIINNIKFSSPDVVFHIVQGKYHGDGTVQAMLELIGIPYVGSRPSEAAIINHKTLCKKIWRSNDILTPNFFEYDFEEYKKDRFDDFKEKIRVKGLTLPVVVKPPTQGSRFGMVFVNDDDSFASLKSSFQYDETLLVEDYVDGRFITQGIFEIDGKMTTLPPVEIIDNSDAKFKRFSGGTSFRSHDFTPERLAEINHITLDAAFQVGASGFARLDYHISNGRPFLLEINAVPGLTPGYSDMCKCVESAGYDYVTFISMLLATAKKDHRR